MSSFIDHTGEVFGYLQAIEPFEVNSDARYNWLCVCVCGQLRILSGAVLRAGRATHCGCRRGIPASSVGSTKDAWYNMTKRCGDPTHRQYKDYGGRGIRVTKRWMLFENFLSDMGVRPEGLSLERVDNNKGYCKGNCKWATASEQVRNTRLTRLSIDIARQVRTSPLRPKDAAKEFGITPLWVWKIRTHRVWKEL